MRFISVLKGGVVASALAASALIPTATASAHTGTASGKCENGVGVITASFNYWGDRNQLVGDIVVEINGDVVDEFVPTADSFIRTYKPYTNGTYAVKGSWALEQNGYPKNYGFEKNVTISGCEPKVEKCVVPGKENLPKNDPKCKEDEKCAVKGKTDLPKNDERCKEDKPQVLPATGPGSMLMLPLLATVAGVVVYNRRAVRQ